MAIFQTYSNNQKTFPDVYIYDAISTKLRNQIFFIWKEFFSQKTVKDEGLVSEAKKNIYEQICIIKGKKRLSFKSSNDNYACQIEEYFEELPSFKVIEILDVIQISFKIMGIIEKMIINRYYEGFKIPYCIDEAIADLNYRFKENGVGYEYVYDNIIRTDNKILHKETIQETLFLLSEVKYSN